MADEKHDPLWDPSASAASASEPGVGRQGAGGEDADLARLEAVLAPLHHEAPLRPLPPRRSHVGSRPRRWWVAIAVTVPMAAAAALALVLWSGGSTPGLRFEAVAGAARIEGGAVASGVLPVGAMLETRAGDRVRVEIADIGTVVLGERSELRLVETGPEQHRLALRHGRLRARVTAPARLFVIDTPAATAVDLGCAYELEVADDGSGWIRVTEGAVELGAGDRVALVPVGARARIVPGRGPGTPVRSAAPRALRRSVERFDRGDRSALDAIASSATPSDTLTLWHVLARADVGPPDRARLYDALEATGLAPAAVDRARVVAGDRGEVDLLREHLERLWLDGVELGGKDRR